MSLLLACQGTQISYATMSYVGTKPYMGLPSLSPFNDTIMQEEEEVSAEPRTPTQATMSKTEGIVSTVLNDQDKCYIPIYPSINSSSTSSTGSYIISSSDSSMISNLNGEASTDSILNRLPLDPFVNCVALTEPPAKTLETMPMQTDNMFQATFPTF